MTEAEVHESLSLLTTRRQLLYEIKCIENTPSQLILTLYDKDNNKHDYSVRPDGDGKFIVNEKFRQETQKVWGMGFKYTLDLLSKIHKSQLKRIDARLKQLKVKPNEIL